MHDHLAAGHETTGITLTYLMHELSINPDVQKTLQEEIHTHFPPSSTPDHTLPDFKHIDTLPYLHACLLETISLHCVAPDSQPSHHPFLPRPCSHSRPRPHPQRNTNQRIGIFPCTATPLSFPSHTFGCLNAGSSPHHHPPLPKTPTPTPTPTTPKPKPKPTWRECTAGSGPLDRAVGCVSAGTLACWR